MIVIPGHSGFIMLHPLYGWWDERGSSEKGNSIINVGQLNYPGAFFTRARAKGVVN